ncbi:MAG TPA: preprotein translocase subunit SecE [Thermotogaceae bacterium]|nr:preprotein translocase subunit SecE [Thermotogota bacterium]HEW91144.1 preprotein translocase subunit SecE [Thermotogaceae bacterium]
MGKLRKFFREIRNEIKIITWPTKKQLITASSAVIVILLVTGVYFAILDLIFSRATSWLIKALGVG